MTAKKEKGSLPTDMHILADRARKVRKFKEISRNEAAQASGVSLAWIQKFESGKHMTGTPKVKTIEKYLHYLGIQVEFKHTFIIK